MKATVQFGENQLYFQHFIQMFALCRRSVIITILKVGSCPNGDIFVQIFFILFCVVFKYFYFLNLFLPRNPQDFAESSCFFICLFPLCWNSDSKNSFIEYP